jgi:uncharacterized protein
MARTVRVFISSTWLDLKPEREAVERALRRVCDAGVVAMEYFGSRPETTREVSLAEVDRSDIYVGIIAHRYGSGITEAEYERAVERELPVLLYHKQTDGPIPPEHEESTQVGRRRLRAFVRTLKDHHTVSVFSNPDNLATLVVADLHNQLAIGRQRGAAEPAALNPFTWRGGITRAEDFFDRDDEQRRLRAYLHNGQSCQIVGPRRIGKTSLMRQLQRKIPEWEPGAVVAYLDLQDPRSLTLAGWLRRAAREFGWSPPPNDLAELAERVEDMVGVGRRPVLCLEEFEAIRVRRSGFGRDFLLTLRSCGQMGMSVVTSSRVRLSELTDPSDPTSPFYNTMAPLDLGPFPEHDVQDFVRLARPGVPSFSAQERTAILGFANGHPLALQVACFQVLETRDNRSDLIAALDAAKAEMTSYLPGW